MSEMMKVVTSHEMSSLEKEAYSHGMLEADFMEKAGEGIAYIVSDYIESNECAPDVILLCGKGNNAGDAYVAGSYLLSMDYSVTALQIVPVNETSALCRQNYNRFIAEGGTVWDGTKPVEQLFAQHEGVIVDGLFGTGFHGTVEEPFASIIELANRSPCPIIAIDIPSGLNGETGAVEGEVVIAKETAFLGLPKKGFFLREGWDCVGKLRHVDFGLPQKYYEGAKTDMVMLTSDFLKPLMPKVRRSRHKYQAGYVVALAGSPGYPGAALLSTSAALHSGAGIVRLLYPEDMEHQLVGAPPELIKTAYTHGDIEAVLGHINKASAALIGPGLGTGDAVVSFVSALLPRVEVPIVIDADMLTILAQHDIKLPRHTVLTPHRGELRRLLHLDAIDEVTVELLERCRCYAEEKNVTLLLKGGPSFIFHSGRPIAVNPTGDPGMATAGSGDVLTGMIAAFMAQGLSPLHATMIATYLHGLAGEHAAFSNTPYCIVASDLVAYFPEAFMFVEL